MPKGRRGLTAALTAWQETHRELTTTARAFAQARQRHALAKARLAVILGGGR